MKVARLSAILAAFTPQEILLDLIFASGCVCVCVARRSQ